jgi:3-phenylpropionate/trans-cinnamate dioxygenase ferredoxin reductase component
VLEREARVLARVASPELAAWLTEHHLGEGTEIITSADVAEFVDRGDGAVGAVRLADGREFACDVALVGVGAIPCDELARDAGLLCEGGIVVDAAARTSDSSVFAVGDVTRRPLHHYEGAHRLESIPSAVEQAKQATCAILGESGPRPEVPWFWSDQFDVKVKIAGLLLGVDATVRRGDPVAGKFALYHLREGRVVAVETVNSSPDFMAGKQLIDHGTLVDPARLGDPAVSLRELAL